MKKILIILSMIILTLCLNKEYDNIVIPDNSIRVRVIANSNSFEDQAIKLKVKDKISKNLFESLNGVKNIEDARSNIKANISELSSIVEDTLGNNDYSINYGQNYFPTKKLYGITYEEGNYESLVVKLGSGSGENWWCVLFPPLCMIDVEKNNISNVEYKSKVLEILNNYN